MAQGLRVFDAAGMVVFESTHKLINYIGSLSVSGSLYTGAAGFSPPQSGYTGTVNVNSDPANGTPGFADGEPWYFMIPKPTVIPGQLNPAPTIFTIFPQVTLNKAAQALTWFYPQRSFATTVEYFYGNATIFYGIR